MLFCINRVIHIHIVIHYLVLIFYHHAEVQTLEKQNEQRWRESSQNYRHPEGNFNGQLKNMSDDAFICGNNYTFYIEALLPSFLLGVLCFTFWFSSTKVNLFLDSFSLKEATFCTNRRIQILLGAHGKLRCQQKTVMILSIIFILFVIILTWSPLKVMY